MNHLAFCTSHGVGLLDPTSLYVSLRTDSQENETNKYEEIVTVLTGDACGCSRQINN